MSWKKATSPQSCRVSNIHTTTSGHMWSLQAQSPVISISMPVLDSNLEAQSLLIFIFFFPLELLFLPRFHFLKSSIKICRSVSSLSSSPLRLLLQRQ